LKEGKAGIIRWWRFAGENKSKESEGWKGKINKSCIGSPHISARHSTEIKKDSLYMQRIFHFFIYFLNLLSSL
jgi:hypothetical protein